MSRLNGLLGTELTIEEVEAIFKRLTFRFQKDGEILTVHVPSRRQDITREVDLIEEVARLYGYDHIPTSMPYGANTRGALTREQSLRRIIRQTLNAMGLDEVSTYSFTNGEIMDDFSSVYEDGQTIRLAMPMSEERSLLRTNLLPHLVETAEYNINRKQRDLMIFEIGNIFTTQESTLTQLPEEKMTLAGLFTGNQNRQHWMGTALPVDFYQVKGVLEELLDRLGIVGVEFKGVTDLQGMHPGRTAHILIQGKTVGYLGQIHPAMEQKYGVGETYVFQVDGAQILHFATVHPGMVPLPKYPEITRDIAVVVGSEVTAGQLQELIKKAAGSLLESVTIFDVYADARLGENKKSIALSCFYRDPEKTLTDEEVQKVHEQVVEALAKEYGAELRA